MLKKIEHFESNSNYSLYIACSKRNFTLMSKLGLFLMCDKNSGFWSEICDIFVQYIGKIGIGLYKGFILSLTQNVRFFSTYVRFCNFCVQLSIFNIFLFIFWHFLRNFCNVILLCPSIDLKRPDASISFPSILFL